jgi:hypothetical protein
VIVGSNKEEYEKHFKNALSNYTGVLGILDNWEMEIPHRSEEPFPANWKDEPLLLMGEYLEVLNLTEDEKKPYRESTLELIKSNGPHWVWENRRRLAAEIEFIRNF